MANIESYKRHFLHFVIFAKIWPVHTNATTQTQADREMDKSLAVRKSRRFSLKIAILPEFEKNHNKYTVGEQIE